MSLQDAKNFVARYVAGVYAPEEQAAFLKWVKGATVEDWNRVADEHEVLVERWPMTAISPTTEWISGLERRLDGVAVERESPVVAIDMRRTVKQLRVRRVWFAAASAAVVIAGTLLYTQQSGSKAGNGQAAAPAPVLAESVNVPRGGHARQVILADGTKIDLNSASTLKYPADFNGPERLVELSGEAFFQVANDAEKPFKVKIKDAEVEVLGTSFNVMAYEDEPVSKTTLIDGKVKMKTGSGEVTLKPGEQVQVNYSPVQIKNSSPGVANGTNMQFNDVNISDVLSWQNGGLDFVDADVYVVMRSLSRYYNVVFKYPSDLPARKSITVGFSLQDGLQQNLKRLEPWFHLHFTTDGKIVTVTSK